MEVIYVLCYKAILEAVWLKKFITNFNTIESISKPLTFYYNNVTTISFSLNNKNFAYKKHFDVKY